MAVHLPRRQSPGLSAMCTGLALTFALGLLDAGCTRSRGPQQLGAAGADGPPELDPIPEDEFEAAMARARCAYEDGCCRRVGLPGVIDSCEQTWRLVLTNDRPSPRSGARYDGAAAAACIDELADFDCRHVKVAEAQWPEACGRIYRRGDLQPGEHCSKPGPYECALVGGADAMCWTLGATPDASECVVLEERGEGEACLGQPGGHAVRTCAPPLRCDFERRVCTRVPERGEPCNSDPFGGDTCARRSVCDAASGRCVAPAALDTPCDPAANLCEAGSCIAGRCREPIRYSVELCAKP